VDNPRSKRVLEKLGFQYERLAEGFALHPNLSSEPRACHLLSYDLVSRRGHSSRRGISAS
jgi:RimJ/RimL family protein N-acetyltransferase